MTPPVESFPASQLQQRVQSTADGRRQKGQMVDMKNCELLEMMQYSCRLDRGPGREAMISCKPIMRLFRRCKNELVVETTAFAGEIDE